MALHQQMEQQRLRWKSEIVSSTGMLHTVGLVYLGGARGGTQRL